MQMTSIDRTVVGADKCATRDIRDAFFDELYTIASRDRNVLFLTADMGALSLDKFKSDLGSQYINVGVAEQNLVSVAAGLALAGKKVFIYAIAPFITQRCYEQIKVDLCCMRLPVTIVGVGAGITYSSDGPTHHAIQDISIMRALPNMTILNPSDATMAAAAVGLSLHNDGPTYVRIDKGCLPRLYKDGESFRDGVALLREGRDVLIVATGVMAHQALQVADALAEHSIDVGVVDLYRLKPLNEQLLLALVRQSNRLVILEEHSLIGGASSAISEILVDAGQMLDAKRLGIMEGPCPGYGDRDWMRTHYGLDIEHVSKMILDWGRHGSGPGRGVNRRRPQEDPAEEQGACSELTVTDFARLFGANISDITEDCREVIDAMDFRYRRLTGGQRDEVFLRVLKTIGSDRLQVAGPARKHVWENGWSESLQDFITGNYELGELIPKFVKSDEIVRLEGHYAKPSNPSFETCFVTALRIYLFREYFSEASSIYEFGCGTGLNLVAAGKLYPEKRLYGLDWAAASCDIISRIAATQHLDLSSRLFDMFNPDYELNVGDHSAVFTIGAMEQLGKSYEPFLQFLLKKRFSVCIHIETIYELYDQSSLFDYVAARYLERRGYLQGYLSRLKELELQGKVEILKTQRTFGSLYHDGYTYVVWKPRP